ncbi:MAG: nucleoside hydrolase [Muribaculaceae bacterium]|jgi:inosine-uridine nucleoside N-ribohydrolase
MTLRILIGMAAAAILSSCGNKQQAACEGAAAPMKIIFETDMGNDVDDALAMDMLMQYAREGKIDLLGISSNKRNDGSTEYIDLLTTWYGMPQIPIGKVVDGAKCDDAVNYALAVAQMTDADGKPLFARSHDNDGFVVPSVEMYRRILSVQPDSSVTVVSVGFSTNLAQLLDSKGDDISPLTGKELVAKKVKELVTMAGEFTNNGEADSLKRMPEYNVVRDIAAAKKVFAEWPTPIVTSPFELGIKICFPADVVENELTRATPHPVSEAYKAYLPMPYDRPTWDLTSVLYAVEGSEGYFTLSDTGDIEVDGRGGTRFIARPDGTRRYLMTDSVQDANILRRFVEMIPGEKK